MTSITDQIDGLIAKVKQELGEFLQNQSVLMSMHKQIASLQSANPPVGNQLNDKYVSLSANQTTLEGQAMGWASRMSTLKEQILANPDIANALSSGTFSAAMFAPAFWAQVSQYTGLAIPLINEGLAISSKLVTQNGEVALLKQSVDRGIVLVPASSTALMNTGLIWAYGLLGLGAAYLVAKKKRKA